MATVTLEDFSAGANTRDSVNLLSNKETPAATNWTLSERGALKWRNGCPRITDLPGGTGGFARIFYSAAVDRWLCARGTELYRRNGDLTSGSWSLLLSGLPDSTLIGFVDWPGTTPLAVFSSQAGATFTVRTWDGTNAPSTVSSSRSNVFVVWQGRAWAFPRVGEVKFYWTALGDITSWPDANNNAIREKDAALIETAAIAGGQLLIFKKRSAYVVTDPNTGNFRTLDPHAGAQGPYAAVTYRGRVYTWGADGIYEWDGVGPGKPVGDRVRPNIVAALPAGENPSQSQPSIVGGVANDRIVFAYPSAPTSGIPPANDRLLEFDPETESVMFHELAASNQNSVSSLANQGSTLYGAIADGDDIFQMFSASPGEDDSVTFTGSYRTPWLQPEGGRMARLSVLRIQGLVASAAASTVLTLKVYKDFDTTTSEDYVLDDLLRGGDVGDQQEHAELRSLGHARSFAFDLVAGTDNGEVTVRSIQLETVALER